MNQHKEESTVRKDTDEQLLYIDDANISIYTQRIVQHGRQKDSTLKTLETVSSSLQDAETYDKTIHFCTNNIAFQVDEQAQSFSIVNLKDDRVQMHFAVKCKVKLLLTQQIMRRKLCEIGFQRKYRIINQLGKGATSSVYLVERLRDNKLFAAKIISLKDSDNKEYETFVNQTKILKALKDVHIVSIQSLYVSKKDLVAVLEYLQGGTLLEELKKDMIKTRASKFKVMKDLALGLEHMRQKRILHRDIKLENIMIRLNKDGTKDYVFTDFGLACWMGEKNLLFERCGTPGYIAPQILRSSKSKVIISHSSDIFSLGVIYHFILLKRAVFPYNGNTKELLAANKRAEFSLDLKARQDLLEIEHEILRATLELDASYRVSTKELLKNHLNIYQEVISQKYIPRFVTAEKEQVYSTNRSRKKSQASEKSIIVTKRSISLTLRNKTVEQTPRNVKEKSFIETWWRKITNPKPPLKKKEDSFSRKQQMKSFLI